MGVSFRRIQGIRQLSGRADFWRIPNAELGRFTVGRLMSVLNRLGARVEVRVKVRGVA